MTEIKIPLDLWDEDIEGTLLGWLYADGAAVEQGEPVVELMVEKVQYELTAPGSGTLRQVVAEDTLIDKGCVIGHIE